MAIKDVKTYIDKHGLVETNDSEVEKPIYRKPGFGGVRSLLEMEEEISRYLRERRDAQNLNREQVGMMVGLHHEIYARHERAGAKLRVTRLLHLAELLDFSPIEALYAAAPHLFGVSEQEAEIKLKLMMRMLDLPASTAQHLLMMIEELSPDSGADISPKRGRTGRAE
ncbi:helix-turn-helix transcriptional regulator [Mesorhizobium microcysteis]|uniref:Helix-turn-helix transcriptional regulator n=1 Tax=Neoaquamicrobium microcysteis TaxID=2682781 RepID=A0A5D4GYK5_9HYPH|nr:helix-turn-helix transcriptional regulator [Mesorhizobium microcysteis]TYR33488.1 helix-turn-helix transcriptional regulator [Mesorhizobium microcysteis]